MADNIKLWEVKMITEISSTYKIKRFTTSTDKDFVTALNIYNHIVPAEIKTSTNEITSFIDLPNQSNREMFFFGLYKDKEVIGYVECAYLTQTKTLMLDYFILQENQIFNSVFYPLYALVMQYFEKNNIDILYKVVEVSLKKEGIVNIESRYLRNLLQAENYKIIKETYPQPELGTGNLESNIDMNLMIATAGEIQSLRSETYIKIVEDIYNNHYLDWYHHFMPDEELSQYKQHVSLQLAKLKKLNLKETLILFNCNTNCKFYGSDKCNYSFLNTAGHPASTQNSKNIKSVVLIIGIVIIITAISIGLTAFLNASNMNSQTVITILSALVPLVTGLVTAITTKKTQ